MGYDKMKDKKSFQKILCGKIEPKTDQEDSAKLISNLKRFKK
jgi:hypothetical protein